MNVIAAILLAALRIVVIPVQFQDSRLLYGEDNVKAVMQKASDYLSQQYGPDNKVTFEPTHYVTLSRNIGYYGANATDRKDARLNEALLEALSLAGPSTDFSQYDNDGDGYVDLVVFFTSGADESWGGYDYMFWPQQGSLRSLGSVPAYDGKRIDEFVICSELNGKYIKDPLPKPSGIGTLCHEVMHRFGLMDLYDTDGILSGGLAKGMWGSTALMDTGFSNNDGNTPANLNAVDLHRLGIGICDTLKTGYVKLDPLSRSRRYLYSPTDKEDEFFLFECRDNSGWDEFIGGQGLLIYHVDQSRANAGYSDYYRFDLTAYDRWNLNQVNCRPDRECADLLEAESDATDVSQVFFPSGRRDNFHSESDPPFRYCSGTPSPFALSDIQRNLDGSVSFFVIEPITIDEVTTFQDAAFFSWTVSDALGQPDCELSLYGPEGIGHTWPEKTMVSSHDRWGYNKIYERLTPGKDYKLRIRIEAKNGVAYSVERRFKTAHAGAGSYAFINLTGASRDKSGRFLEDSRVPLRVDNAPGAAVEWSFEGRVIKPDPNGYFTVPRSGELKAVITYYDGRREILVKQITVK